jgi:putative transposase
VCSFKDWPWSSYRATAGLISTPVWLQTDWILSNFGLRKGRALERYRAFVSVGKSQISP